jgi:hypothetical protein
MQIFIGEPAGMKSKSWIIWVLAALLVMTSLDAIPDPPAVNPSKADVSARHNMSPDSLSVRHLNSDWSCPFSRQPRVGWLALTSAFEPNHLSDCILKEQATDLPPPALNSRRAPYFPS